MQECTYYLADFMTKIIWPHSTSALNVIQAFGIIKQIKFRKTQDHLGFLDPLVLSQSPKNGHRLTKQQMTITQETTQMREKRTTRTRVLWVWSTLDEEQLPPPYTQLLLLIAPDWKKTKRFVVQCQLLWGSFGLAIVVFLGSDWPARLGEEIYRIM